MASHAATAVGRASGAPHRSPTRTRIARQQALTGLLFVAPAVLGVVALGLIPFAFVVVYALHSWDPLVGEMEWVGLANFQRLIADAVVWQALRTTLLFAAGLVVFNMTLALALALLLNQRVRGLAGFRAAYFVPVVVSTVAWVLIWEYLVADNGSINGFLALLGIDGPNWLREPSVALITVIVIQVFKNVGMNMVLFLAALQGVPGELKEAARLDGAGAVRTFRSIVFPILTPMVLLVSLITMIGAMDVFVPIQVLTEGGPGRSTTVLSYLLYRTAFVEQDFGYASTIGVLLFVVVLTLTLLQWQGRKRWVHNEI